jgi:hypothetical protein
MLRGIAAALMSFRVSTKKNLAIGFSLILISLNLVLMTPGNALAQTAVTPSGKGTSASPYQISQIGHLIWMSDNVSSSSGKYYTMTADIDASSTSTWYSGAGFVPIGTSYSNFLGTFDGGGHTITGLVINRSTTDYVGLFGYIGSGSVVKNIGLNGGSVTGHSYVGGLIGYKSGTVSNAYATGEEVMGSFSYVGGLVGYNYSGTVSNAYATGAVTGVSEVGGLVGYSYYGTVSNAFATGSVTSEQYVGGLVGVNWYGTVSNAYATGSVTGTGSSSRVGGLVGQNGGTVSNAYATGEVTGHSYVGGLVGMNNSSGMLSNAYASGVITGGFDVGGLVGRNDGTVSNVYATGAVSGTGIYIGGLIGGNGGTVTNSYWDIEASGWSTSAGGMGKTTAEMKQQTMFTEWNFSTTWGIAEGVSYPYLQLSPPPFKLTVTVTGACHVTLSPEPEGGCYAAGTWVTLTMVPAA